MKKKIAAALLALTLVLCLPISAHAELGHTISNWTVSFNADNIVHSNFKSNEINELLSNMEPGDSLTFNISVSNFNSQTVDWYMKNPIPDSLENGTASLGGYTYKLTYTDSNNAVTEFYNSDKVGGGQEGQATQGEQGLREVDSALKNYMYLQRMTSGQRAGVVTLEVSLDGESQGNSYQDTNAEIDFRFAVEIVPVRRVVKTGDDGLELSPIYIGMCVAGVAVLLLAVDGAVRNKKKKRGQKT